MTGHGAPSDQEHARPFRPSPLPVSAFPRPYASSLHLLPANFSNGFGENRMLAGGNWMELESGGGEHNMSTLDSTHFLTSQ